MGEAQADALGLVPTHAYAVLAVNQPTDWPLHTHIHTPTHTHTCI